MRMSGTKTTRRFSRSAEDYLRLIYELGHGGEEVGVSALAGRLGISAASVTGMAKRLAGVGLVDRTPYRGLSLIGEGRKAALGVVRRHRLIELYPVEALGYSWDEVHEEAENLEHAASEGFVDRLERLLGHPEAGAHGFPIPPGRARSPRRLACRSSGSASGSGSWSGGCSTGTRRSFATWPGWGSTSARSWSWSSATPSRGP